MRKKNPVPAVLKLKRFCFFALLVLALAPCKAQHSSSFQVEQVEELAEELAQQAEQGTPDPAIILEDLFFYAHHPLNLNQAKKEELQALHLLTDLQINSLMTHLENNGELILIYELQAIEGFDLHTIQKLLPYVHVDHTLSSFSKTNLLKGGHTLVLRFGQVLEKQTGFAAIDTASLCKKPNSRYMGSPQKIYTSYRFTAGKTIRLGITAEKDAGEPFFKPRLKFNDQYTPLLKKKLRNGFDFYSAYLFVQDIKQVKAFVIGDYTITFGQGLTAWNGLSIGKSSEVLYTKKNASGIRPYTSSDENHYLRGFATTLQLRTTTCTFFYSQKKVDARIRDTLEDGSPAILSSLQQTGMHVTLSEIAGKHMATECAYGGNIHYNRKRFNIGITLLHEHLNFALQPQQQPAYNQFENEQPGQLNIGLDYQFIRKNFHFFGETTRSRAGGMAFLNGLFISPDPRLSFTALHRYYGKNYQNRLSAPFNESSSFNEKGIYMGLIASLSPSVTVNACFDRFEFPWLKFQVNAPSSGNSLSAQLSYTCSKKLILTIRTTHRNKQKNTKELTPVPYLVAMHSQDYRFTVSYSFTKTIQFRNRIELLHYTLESATQNGYLIYQDILFHNPGKPLSATLRYSLFQTDGYDSRLYEYEQDCPGAYSIPSFYDKGSRFYVLFNYSVNKHVEFWFRYAQTFYDNKEVISEGSLSEIKGNTKSEVNLQMRISL